MAPARWLLLRFVLPSLLLFAAACGDASLCYQGKACGCVAFNCSRSCGAQGGGGCAFQCTQGATRAFSCPGGNCALVC